NGRTKRHAGFRRCPRARASDPIGITGDMLSALLLCRWDAAQYQGNHEDRKVSRSDRKSARRRRRISTGQTIKTTNDRSYHGAGGVRAVEELVDLQLLLDSRRLHVSSVLLSHGPALPSMVEYRRFDSYRYAVLHWLSPEQLS
ncbi:hypothetical protein PENTCL1PPCAC_28813, partial [Pristionchus entomophagus]